MSTAPAHTRWSRVLGIVGGLGPHAHVEFERRLLDAVEATRDQDYPPWIVSSLPGTPDRTRAILEGGTAVAPYLLESLRRLAGRADFAVIACVTAHAFLGRVRPAPLPVLDLVEATLLEVVARYGEDARIGVLGTSGTLESRVFPAAAGRVAPGLSLVSLLDVPDGERLQEEWVMTPIYGRSADGRRTGGLKAGAEVDPATGTPLSELLARAAGRLGDEGVDVVLAACTEIGMALGSRLDAAPAILDPLDVAAREALAVARGTRPLPPL